MTATSGYSDSIIVSISNVIIGFTLQTSTTTIPNLSHFLYIYSNDVLKNRCNVHARMLVYFIPNILKKHLIIYLCNIVNGIDRLKQSYCFIYVSNIVHCIFTV